MKKIITILLLYPIVLFGQAAGGNDPILSDEAGIGEISSKDPVVAAQEKLNEKGWEQGWNENKKQYILIGKGAIKVPSNHPAFSLARRRAFTEARLNAQTQLASYLSQEVGRNIEEVYEEPSLLAENIEEINKAGNSDPGIIDKAEMLIHAELDEALERKGISPASEQSQEVVRELMSSSRMKDAIEASARAEAAGMMIYDIYESTSHDSIAVIGIFSEKTRQLAGAILGKNPSPPMKAKEPIKNYISSISPDELIATYGVKTRPDENGNLCLIGFGQSKPRTKSSTSKNAAFDKARIAALGELRSFAGELVAVNESGGMSDSFDEFADDISDYKIEENYEKITSARASKLKMPGIQTIHNWSTTDTRSGETIAGVVLKWSLGDAMQANVLRDQMNSLGGSRGGVGTSNLRPKTSSSGSSSKGLNSSTRPRVGGLKSGADSDDDDF